MSEALAPKASKVVRVLVIEDSESDARLVVRTLQQGGFEVEHERVQSAVAMRAALARQAWDAVIADFPMPGFTGLDALKIVRDSGSDIPFLLISGSIGEETAVEIMKAGADDYVLKENLARLAPALERELREAARREAHCGAEAELQMLGLAVKQSGTAIVITDPAGAIEFVNPKFEAMTGYAAAEVLGRNPRLLKSGAQPAEFYRELWQTITSGKDWHGDLQNRRKSGELYFEQQHISPVLDDAGTIRHFVAIKEDVTEQRRMETALRESERKYRRIYESLQDAYVETSLDGTVLEVSPQIETLSGGQYRREDFLGKPSSVFYANPGERDGLMRVLRAKGRVLDHELTFRNRDGSLLPASISAKLVFDEEGRPERIASMMRDSSERNKSEERIRRLNRVYAVLSGINALIVRVRDRDELFRKACGIAVEHGNFSVAWAGIVERGGSEVIPLARRGVEEAYVSEVPRSVDTDGPDASGIIGEAIRTRQPVISNDIEHDVRLVRRLQALKAGSRALVVLPLVVADIATGVLVLHAREKGFFDDEEMKLLRELAGDIAFALENIARNEQLDYLAYYDSLTGLANPTLFHERLQQYLGSSAYGDGKLALVFADIERLKTVNDSLGRQAGDALLRQFAERLAGAAGQTQVARISADQFAIVLPGVSGKEAVARQIEEIARTCFHRPYVVNGSEVRISAKWGIALHPDHASNAETLSRNAEAALAKAKESHERVLFYTQDLIERAAESLTLENQLRQALERNEFVLHYQPKADLASGRIAGVEALIRWASPELGLVPPAKFIPVMERTGLIQEAGAWALRQAVDDHRRWRELGLSAPRVAVNVSAMQLRRRDFVATVQEAIARGATPTGLDLEITESLLMHDIKGTIEKLKALHDLGLEIAIDDFGTGYSSLGYLAKLPVQMLKIDRSFILTMQDDPNTMTLVSTVISLAHSLRLKVVAEGVETDQQAKFLRLLRCNEMQGYVFSRPLPFEGMTALLRNGASWSAAK